MPKTMLALYRYAYGYCIYPRNERTFSFRKESSRGEFSWKNHGERTCVPATFEKCVDGNAAAQMIVEQV